MRRIRSVVVLVVVTAAMGVAVPGRAPAAALAAAAPGGEVARADFDDDGFVDLAVGVPGEDVAAHNGAGAVVVLYGADAGLTGAGAQLFHQDLPGIADTAEAGDAFGAALASGDFDADGFADLAVGIPGEDQGQSVDLGGVHLLFGTAGGLTAAGSRGLFTEAEPGDRFGAALAAGDMTPGGSFSDDLAVGAPGEDVGAAVDAGAVNLIAGTEAGLAPGALYLQGRPERGDRFGSALTLNNFLGSGDDLAVGAPGETVAGIAGAGAVSLFDGTATAPGREWLLHEGLANSGPVEAGDAFGAALGWYTVHPGGFLMTLVVGAPGRNRFGTDAGAVFPCYSYPGQGLLCDQHRLQDEGAGAEAGDAYGAAVSGGSYFTADRNFYDADGLEDVVVGAPGETVGSARGAGAATIIYGDQYFEIQTLLYQGHGGVGGTPEPGDAFGAAVA
jgi:FG-GAP repeat